MDREWRDGCVKPQVIIRSPCPHCYPNPSSAFAQYLNNFIEEFQAKSKSVYGASVERAELIKCLAVASVYL